MYKSFLGIVSLAATRQWTVRSYGDWDGGCVWGEAKSKKTFGAMANVTEDGLSW